MNGKKPRYGAELKDEVLRYLRTSGRSQVEVARSFGIPDRTLRRWERQGPEAAPRGALTVIERAEMKRLRRENAALREEQEILKKAAAFFAKETR
jgi:transposase